MGVGRALAALLMGVDKAVCRRRASVMDVSRTVQGTGEPIVAESAVVTAAQQLYQHFIRDLRLPQDIPMTTAELERRRSRAFLAVRRAALCVRSNGKIWYAAPREPGALGALRFQQQGRFRVLNIGRKERQ